MPIWKVKSQKSRQKGGQAKVKSRIYGFSLVEILIVISILALMISLASTSFSNFSKSSRLASVAADLKGDLRFVQNKALAGDKSTPKCSSSGYILVGWYVTISQNTTSYSLSAICKNSSGVEESEAADYKTVTLPDGVAITSNSASTDVRVLFQPIIRGASVHNKVGSTPYFYDSSGGIVNQVSTNNPFSITLSSGSGGYQVTIMPSGEISEKKL